MSNGIRPLQLAFYKGMGGKHGAVQFNVQPPHYYVAGTKLKNYEGKWIPSSWLQDNPNLKPEDLVSREGCLFLTITSATGKNIYDWEQKITVALSVTDMAQMLTVIQGQQPEMKLVHDPGAGTESKGKIHKVLNISSPQGHRAGVILNATEKSPDGTFRSHTVPLSGAETLMLGVCLRHEIPKALGW